MVQGITFPCASGENSSYTNRATRAEERISAMEPQLDAVTFRSEASTACASREAVAF